MLVDLVALEIRLLFLYFIDYVVPFCSLSLIPLSSTLYVFYRSYLHFMFSTIVIWKVLHDCYSLGL